MPTPPPKPPHPHPHKGVDCTQVQHACDTLNAKGGDLAKYIAPFLWAVTGCEASSGHKYVPTP